MKTLRALSLLLLAAGLMTGCETSGRYANDAGSRALVGGLIGAGLGAGIGAATGGTALSGAGYGAAAGMLVGVLSD